MRRQLRCAPSLAAAMALVLCLTGAAAAQVLQQVPPDALVVVKFNNLKQVSDRIGVLAQQWNIAAFQPAAADPLGAFQEQMGIKDGLATDGELAFAALKPKEEGDEPRPLLLVPVSDYQAFIGNFAGAQTNGAVTTINMAGAGQENYVAQWGQYAAIGESADDVATPPAQPVTIKGAATQELLGGRDIVMWANMVALRDLGVPAIEGQRQEILAQVDEALSEDEQSKPYSAPARELVSRMLDVAVGFLKQTDSASIGASLSNDGIGVTILTDFVPDSYSADLVGNLRPQGVAADDSLISGIPQGSYLFLAGSVGNGEAVAGAIEDLLAPVRPKLEGTGEAGEAIESYLDALLKQVRATERSTAGMLRPTGPLMGGEGLFRIVSVMSGNSQDIVQGYKEMMLVQQDIMKAVASAMPEASASMNMQATVAENATTVDGVSFDKITSTFGGDPNDPQAAQVKQMMQIMYGPEGQTTYLGKVDEKTSVMVMGSQALLADAVAAAKAKTDPLAAAPNVAAVSQKLPGQRISVGYIMLGDIVATALGFAQQFGAPFNVQIPENLPPVGMSMSTQEPAVRTDVFIHSKLVEALVGAGMQVMMQMQGGGQQPGGPEGL